MKSPDEIKKGLFVCSDFEGNCPYCPYAVNGHRDPEGMCVKQLANDADRLIQQLETQNAEQSGKTGQLEAENKNLRNKIRRMQTDRNNDCGHAGPGIRSNY